MNKDGKLEKIPYLTFLKERIFLFVFHLSNAKMKPL